MQEISLTPNIIFSLFNLPITSAMLATFVVTALIALFAYFAQKNVSLIPSRFQVASEAVVDFFYAKSLDATNSKKRAITYTNITLSLFLFVFLSNQFTIIPLVQSIVTSTGPLFRTPTSHFSETIALALITVFISHVFAFWVAPVNHLDNLFSVKSLASIRSVKDLPTAFLNLFLGVLNIVGELSKIISLAARLFGNIFAGEVLVAVIAGLSIYTAFFVPIPFILISMFSGLIQAVVFSFLAFSFISNNVEGALEK